MWHFGVGFGDWAWRVVGVGGVVVRARFGSWSILQGRYGFLFSVLGRLHFGLVFSLGLAKSFEVFDLGSPRVFIGNGQLVDIEVPSVSRYSMVKIPMIYSSLSLNINFILPRLIAK